MFIGLDFLYYFVGESLKLCDIFVIVVYVCSFYKLDMIVDEIVWVICVDIFKMFKYDVIVMDVDMLVVEVFEFKVGVC